MVFSKNGRHEAGFFDGEVHRSGEWFDNHADALARARELAG